MNEHAKRLVAEGFQPLRFVPDPADCRRFVGGVLVGNGSRARGGRPLPTLREKGGGKEQMEQQTGRQGGQAVRSLKASLRVGVSFHLHLGFVPLCRDSMRRGTALQQEWRNWRPPRSDSRIRNHPQGCRRWSDGPGPRGRWDEKAGINAYEK